MKLRKLRSLFALVAAVVTTMVLIQPQQAVGQTSTVGGLQDGGVLRLRLGPTDHFKWQPPAGSDTPAQTQAISTSGGCGASLTGPSLVGLSASGGSVGFVSDGFGVRGSGEGSGQPCGRVDGSQKLSVQLGSVLANRAVDFAELDIEGKFDAAFTIQASLGGSPVGSPASYATAGTDSGPDSGDGDNFRVRFPKTGTLLFDKLTFSVTSGAISLEGGADGTEPCDSTLASECLASGSLGETIDGGSPTTDSLFHLVKFDGLLNCNAPAVNEPSGAAGEPSITLVRLNNIGGASCTPIPYDLETLTGQVDILKDLLGQEAQFRAVITWPAREETYPLQASTIDYDGPGGDAPVQLEWCLADGTNNTADGFPDLPTGTVHFYCLEKQEATDGLESGLVTVKETLYGQLDPSVRR